MKTAASRLTHLGKATWFGVTRSLCPRQSGDFRSDSRLPEAMFEVECVCVCECINICLIDWPVGWSVGRLVGWLIELS